MRTIDLNADLGELDDGSLDAAVMPFISSANIACGAHAGNVKTMRRTVRLAKKHGVAIGAHPGYADHENFGRLSISLSEVELCRLILDQIILLKQVAAQEDVSVVHVKLHGALYNDLAVDYERSLLVCRAIYTLDPQLKVIVFSNSETARAAEDVGLRAIHEVFADRVYTDSGALMSRSLPGAVIHDVAASLVQVESMVLRQKVSTSGNKLLPIQADSVCVHGDNPSAIHFVSQLHQFFEQQQVKVCSVEDYSFTFFMLGERSMLACLPTRISPSTHRKIRSLMFGLKGCPGICELVPCYSELKIDFDPALISYDELCLKLKTLSQVEVCSSEPRLIEVPVVYDGDDLSRVAAHTGLRVEDVVRLHSEPIYPVYMLGFSPGFPYLGGLRPEVATPRLATPRVTVPAGAVGIAGSQTGIYPVESPGGWNIIGHTQLTLFDPSSERPFLFEPGDEVRFVPVSKVGHQGGASFVSRAQETPSGPVVRVVDAGMYTTVQDKGRFGYLRYGLPPSGVMDRCLFDLANALLGNDAGAAVLECTGNLPVLEFSQSTRIVVVYADSYECREVAPGERICFPRIKTGYRAYIGVAGGIDVPEVMGSRSTYIPAALGGFDGRVLRAGDRLKIGCAKVQEPRMKTPVFDPVRQEIRVVPGPEAHWFDCGGLNTFLTESFAVSSKSDRTGIRLEGKALSFCSDAQMVSSGIGMGTIQVPPSGLPIIMMADHPTTGGYPRIGNVVEADLSALAQLKPGDEVRFLEQR